MSHRFVSLVAALLCLHCAGVAPPPQPAGFTEPPQVAEVALSSPPDGVPIVLLNGAIDDDMATAFVQAFTAIGAVQRIVVEINSPGGGVDAGFLIARTMERSAARIYCIVDGDADSMAFYILQSCDVRAMTYRSVLMAHGPSLGLQGYFNRGATRSLLRRTEVLERALFEHMAHRLTIGREEFLRRIADGAWWMNFDEADQVGAVDLTAATARGFIRWVEALPAPVQPAPAP